METHSLCWSMDKGTKLEQMLTWWKNILGTRVQTQIGYGCHSQRTLRNTKISGLESWLLVKTELRSLFWWQTYLPTELSCQPLCIFFKISYFLVFISESLSSFNVLLGISSGYVRSVLMSLCSPLTPVSRIIDLFPIDVYYSCFFSWSVFIIF